MGDYGFEFSNSWTTRVDSTFSNYSQIKVFSAGVSAGFNTISLQCNETEPMIAVRHPGVTVGFLRLIVGTPTKVELYCQQAGTIYFIVFTPRQVLGETGWGLRLTDANGLEVYHSDLFYLDVNNFVAFGGHIGEGYYMLGSFRGMKFDFEELTGSSSVTVPIYGWIYEEVCGYYWNPGYYEYQCGYESGYEYVCEYQWNVGYVCNYVYVNNYVCNNVYIPGEYVYDCRTELVNGVLYYQTTYSYSYAITLDKTMGCVQHATNNYLYKKDVRFWTGTVFESSISGVTTSSVEFWGEWAEDMSQLQSSILSTYGTGLQATYDPRNVSSSPNTLLVSPMEYV